MAPKLPEDIFDPKTPDQKHEATEAVRDKINKERNAEFGRYLTDAFVRTMKSPAIAGRILGFQSMDMDGKIAFTQAFMGELADLINTDIDDDKVKIYNYEMEPLKGRVSEFSLNLFKEDIKLPHMKAMDFPTKGFLMAVNHIKELKINFDYPMYGMTDCFLMDLRHECAHVVDIYSPQISPLGREVAGVSIRNYVTPEENADYYDQNHLEENGQLDRAEYAGAIRAALKEIEEAFRAGRTTLQAQELKQ